MSNFRDLWGGFAIMVFCILAGIIMSLAGGIVIDYTHGHIDALGWFDTYNSWDPNWGGLSMIENLYYGFWGFLIPCAGVAFFLKTAIARQGYDQYLGQ